MRKSIVIASCIFAALLCSCASNSDITRLQDEIADVRSQAELALSESRAARNAAEDANSRARRTEEMLNRSFQKSMYK